MTDEEQKRINDRLERIETLLLSMATESTARFADHEVWFRRFETDLASELSTSNARFVRMEANLELLQNFMRDSAHRSEERLDKIEIRIDKSTLVVQEVVGQVERLTTSIASLVRLFEDHTRNG